MSTQIRISAKNLGELGLTSFCPRCFWLKLKVANKLPFQIFPGIFSSIDSYTKSIVHGYFDNHGCAPAWLAELGAIQGYINPPHYTAFKIVDTESNVMLWGSPDAVFVKPDGSHIIGDYKTAKYTKTQDSLLPMYDIQLNSYALIGEQCDLHPVTDLALIYMQPKTDKDTACLPASHHECGFHMQFDAHIHQLRMHTESIPALLARVREIYEMDEKPDKRDDCKDCAALEQLFTHLYQA